MMAPANRNLKTLVREPTRRIPFKRVYKRCRENGKDLTSPYHNSRPLPPTTFLLSMMQFKCLINIL
jgi:hypothetical protein